MATALMVVNVWISEFFVLFLAKTIQRSEYGSEFVRTRKAGYLGYVLTLLVIRRADELRQNGVSVMKKRLMVSAGRRQNVHII